MTNQTTISSVWIYGKGGFAHDVAEFLKKEGVLVIGFISNSGFEIGNRRGDVKLYEENRFPVVIGVFNHKDNPVEIVDYLESINVSEIISPAGLMNIFREKSFSKYYLDTNVDMTKITDYRKSLIEKLHDDESIHVIDGFINYRLTGDVRKLIRSGGPSEQYLGKTLPTPYDDQWLSGDFKWFDIGSFDGDTLRAIKDSGRDMRSDIYICAEPDNLNFEKLKITVKNIDAQTILFNVAIGETNGKIEFTHEGTLSAKRSEEENKSDSTTSVEVMTIDKICKDFEPTHIKMDIEGAELNAILGGMNTLKLCRPKIAVSLYHKPLDIVELCSILMDNLEDYSWFVRSYGAHGYDTILYGLPK